MAASWATFAVHKQLALRPDGYALALPTQRFSERLTGGVAVRLKRLHHIDFEMLAWWTMPEIVARAT